jgi:uncharacterized membrane protein
MPRIHKHIEIKAPVREVFSYIENPKNDPDWMPSMIEVMDIHGSGAGTNFKWSWKMAGFRFEGESTFVEDIPDKELVVKSKGGIEATWTFKVEPRKDATSLDVDIDYSVPIPVLGKLAEKLLMKRNEREADLGLLNLKERLEAEL